MNSVVLIGRLVADPISGNGCSKYTLAVERNGKNGVDYINCVAFGRLGEFANNYLRKGIKIAVNGRIQTGKYKNKNGEDVYTVNVVVSEHEFVEPMKDHDKE